MHMTCVPFAVPSKKNQMKAVFLWAISCLFFN